ncbi:MAG: hypothetical protein ACRC8S_23000 [Fimbriiglobus sp.]
MDADSEVAKAKWLLISVVVFLFSGCISWTEMSYLLFGKDAQADVTNAYEVTRRGKFGTGGRKQLVIDYAFNEPDGTRRTGTENVSLDWPMPKNGKVPVRYISGADSSSRLAGQVRWGGLALFGASLGLISFFGFRLWREANDDGPRKPRRK